MSTLPHIGQAVAALLSLPLRAEEEDRLCLENYRNKVVYTKSFTLTQRDILASACRSTDTEEVDWTIEKGNVQEHFKRGQYQMRDGDVYVSRTLYTRVFFTGDGD